MSSAMLYTLGIGVVAVCAGMAMSGYRGRTVIVGIDLGTSYSVVAYQDQYTGKSRVVPCADNSSQFTTPSVVSYLPGGEVVVGRAAKARWAADAADTVHNAKRFLGRPRFDADALAYAAAHHLATVAAPRGEGERDGDGGETAPLSGTWFSIRADGHGGAVAPEAVGAAVVRTLLDNVAAHLGHRMVRKAVIAVPAAFDNRQRAATALAFKQAGIKVARTLDEPVAAALAYELHRKPGVTHILVYDFGGGTLDVSVLFVREGSVETVASAGDNDLGGSDFDVCLGAHLANQLPPAAKADSACLHEVMAAVEKAKIHLSTHGSVEVEAACGAGGAGGGGAHADRHALRATPESFRAACAAEFERALSPVAHALELSYLEKGHIDEVVLVGGSSRIPFIRDALRAEFPDAPLNLDLDADLVVALGAANVID